MMSDHTRVVCGKSECTVLLRLSIISIKSFTMPTSLLPTVDKQASWRWWLLVCDVPKKVWTLPKIEPSFTPPGNRSLKPQIRAAEARRVNAHPMYERISAGAIGLPWAFREHDNFSTDFYILDHANFLRHGANFFVNVFCHFYAN